MDFISSITRRFSESVCVWVAKSVSQLPICASRWASLSCSSRCVASACSLSRSVTARSRSTVAISTFAIDSTNARSSSEKAPLRRLQATSSPNAVAPAPTGAATRLIMPSPASPGARDVVSARPRVSSVSPAARMSPILRRTWGEGSGGRGGASPALARTEMLPSREVSSTITTSLASAPWSTRAAASNSSGRFLPWRASEPSELTAACWVRRWAISSRPSTRSEMSWAIRIAPTTPAFVCSGEKCSQ